MPSSGIFYLLVSLLEFRQFLYSSAMNYLCHHDWDASNLMMNSKGQLVMIDFGLSVYYLSHPKEGGASQFHNRTEISNSTFNSYHSSIVDIRRRFMYTSDCSDPAKLVILLQKLTQYLPLKSRTCVSALMQNDPKLPKLLDTQPNLTCHLIRGIKRCFYQQAASEEENFLINFPTKAPALVNAHGDSVSWPDIIVQVHPNLSQL